MYGNESKRPPSVPQRVVFASSIYILFLGCYGIVNRLIPMAACADLTTPLDRLIPFVPQLVFPFYLVYALILMPAILVRDHRLLVRSAVAFAALIILSCMLFVLIPVHVPRPVLIPDSIAGWLVSEVFRVDRPVCGFPSLHASTAFLAAMILFTVGCVTGLVSLTLATLTSLSTLFIKQHVVLDVMAGLILALAMHQLVVAGAAGGLGRAIRAGLLLLRNTRPRRGGGENPRISESRRSTHGGVCYDLYEPRSSPRRTWVMIYGLTLQGERDPRLVNFSRCFAESGFRVAVPELPGLKSCRFDQADLRAIAALVSALHSEYGAPVGVTAFSFGAGYALTAAADPAVSSIMDPLLLFGPYHSLMALRDTVLEHWDRTPENDDQWDDYIWIRMVLAFRAMESLHLHAREREELIDLLENYCVEPSLERKRSFYASVIQGREGMDMETLIPDGRILERLSPCGKLRMVRSRVLILHDKHDRLIPPEHSQRIHEELCSRHASRGQKLLVTPLLSHVTPRTTWELLDVFRILGIVGGIFR